MATRIDLRGVIVPSEYDSEWMAQYIAKGIITPESYFRAKLDAAPKDQPLDVYVNSPGGSVFAAGEMVNATLEWKAATGQPVNVTVGALCASAASAYAIMAADTVRAHNNAKMMFHGAWTVSIGGKEMHQDTADLLAKINADVQTRLVSRYNISPETVAEWFAEGREGWLNAEDMKASGIASEIIGDNAEVIDLPADAATDFSQRGMAIAALFTAPKAKEPAHVDNKPEPAKEPAAVDDPKPGPSAVPAVPCSERIAGRAEGRAEAVAEFSSQVEALKERCNKADTHARAMQSARDKAESDLTKARADHAASLSEMSAKMKDATDRLAKLLHGGLAFSPAPQTWEEALKACGGDYATAAKNHPELRREYNKQKSQTK